MTALPDSPEINVANLDPARNLHPGSSSSIRKLIRAQRKVDGVNVVNKHKPKDSSPEGRAAKREAKQLPFHEMLNKLGLRSAVQLGLAKFLHKRGGQF